MNAQRKKELLILWWDETDEDWRNGLPPEERELVESWDKATHRVEDRCHQCTEKDSCPAYDTGVIYPCPYFKEVL